jgi:hypoxanthine phosphoribosyltransferase
MDSMIKFSYDDIHRHTLSLIDKIVNPGVYIDYIAAISRGGLVPGIIMSHHLGIPLIPVQWSTRDHTARNRDSVIAEDLASGSTILLVDDINDSGQTFIELIADWEYNDQCRGKLITATLFQRYSTQRPSNFYDRLIETDNWIQFPWEK